MADYRTQHRRTSNGRQTALVVTLVPMASEVPTAQRHKGFLKDVFDRRIRFAANRRRLKCIDIREVEIGPDDAAACVPAAARGIVEGEPTDV